MANEIISLANLQRFKSKYDTYVANLIASAIANVYRAKGSKTVAQLNSLTGQTDGDVYNVTDSGTLSAGSVSVVAGDNVVWTTEGGTGKWDKLAGIVDLSSYLPLSAGSTKALTGTLYALAKGATSATASSISASGDIELYAIGNSSKIYFKSNGGVVVGGKGVNGGVTIDLNLLSTTNRTIHLPDANGTFALQEDLSATNIATYLGYTPYDGSTNPNGYITGITSTMITNALGYTPYSSANPNGYISGITSSMVTTALGYTPLSTSDFATDSDIDAMFL